MSAFLKSEFSSLARLLVKVESERTLKPICAKVTAISTNIFRDILLTRDEINNLLSKPSLPIDTLSELLAGFSVEEIAGARQQLKQVFDHKKNSRALTERIRIHNALNDPEKIESHLGFVNPWTLLVAGQYKIQQSRYDLLKAIEDKSLKLLSKGKKSHLSVCTKNFCEWLAITFREIPDELKLSVRLILNGGKRSIKGRALQFADQRNVILKAAVTVLAAEVSKRRVEKKLSALTGSELRSKIENFVSQSGDITQFEALLSGLTIDRILSPLIKASKKTVELK